MFRQAIILFIFLASVEFFRLIFIPKQVFLLLSFGATVIMTVVIIINSIYDSGKKGFFQNFKFEIILMFIAVALSMFGARYGHGQSFLLSSWVQMGMYYYFFYFFLHTVRVRPKELENLMLIMAFIWIFLYVAQYVLYPRMLINLRVEEARGTIRIFLPGGGFTGVMFLYFLHKFFISNKKAYLLYCLLYAAIQVSKGTRSTLASFIFIVVIYILFSKQVRSRIAVILLMFFGAVMFFFIFQDIFISLIDISKTQSAQEGDDIRVRAARFFLTEFYPNTLNYFTGNGVSHMASPYGLKVWFYKTTYGYFQSDLGVLGAFTKFGVLYVLSILLMFRKMFIIPIEAKNIWLRFFVLTLATGAIMGEPFSQPSSIVVILTITYIIDVSNFEKFHSPIVLEKTKT